MNRRGFTLIELLIVIVVIGILAAMMILSATEAILTAKVNNIIVSLNQWKKASMEWYVDNIDKVNERGWIRNSDGEYKGSFSEFFSDSCVKAKDVMPYLGSELKLDKNDNVVDNAGGIYKLDYYDYDHDATRLKGRCDWVIVYELPKGDKDNERLLTKLEGRAQSTGLIRRKVHGGWAEPFTIERGGNGKPSNSYYVAMKTVEFNKK